MWHGIQQHHLTELQNRLIWTLQPTTKHSRFDNDWNIFPWIKRSKAEHTSNHMKTETSARLHYIIVQLIFTSDHKIHLFIFHVFSFFLLTETMMPNNRVINNDHRCGTSHRCDSWHRWRRMLISGKLWSDMNVNTLPEEVVSVHWLPETYSTHYVCYVTLMR